MMMILISKECRYRMAIIIITPVDAVASVVAPWHTAGPPCTIRYHDSFQSTLACVVVARYIMVKVQHGTYLQSAGRAAANLQKLAYRDE